MTSTNMKNKYISDELLAAFLEGNVNEEEMTQVISAAKSDAQLREVLNVALKMEDESLPILQMAAEGGRNLCDVQCEAYVLQHQDIEATEESLFEIAKDNHWLRRAGTPLYCIGNLLAYKGLEVERQFNSSLDDIERALDKGWGLIAAVDSDKLYPGRPDEEDATNHAVVVSAIDNNKDTVTIYDPGNTVELDIKTPLFLAAWKESRFYLVTARKKK